MKARQSCMAFFSYTTKQSRQRLKGNSLLSNWVNFWRDSRGKDRHEVKFYDVQKKRWNIRLSYVWKALNSWEITDDHSVSIRFSYFFSLFFFCACSISSVQNASAFLLLMIPCISIFCFDQQSTHGGNETAISWSNFTRQDLRIWRTFGNSRYNVQLRIKIWWAWGGPLLVLAFLEMG